MNSPDRIEVEDIAFENRDGTWVALLHNGRVEVRFSSDFTPHAPTPYQEATVKALTDPKAVLLLYKTRKTAPTVPIGNNWFAIGVATVKGSGDDQRIIFNVREPDIT